MKATKLIPKSIIKQATMAFIVIACFSCTETVTTYPPSVMAQPAPSPTPPSGATKIKIGLLLDTSNSMDGLIDQAKAQLWKIVNELSLARTGEEQAPELMIALYEYGNDRLSAREGYIRMVTPLTNDLDQVSKDLFSLKTKGGSEFCGHVIQTSLNQLDWSENPDDLKLIFIAGNEPFTQGSVNYLESCGSASAKGVTINTIFCGDFQEGINTSWKNGADITGGYYMSIEQNRKTVYIESPYDDQINELNTKLNDTYVPYGRMGFEKHKEQKVQDENAKSYGSANSAMRTLSKSSHVYKNSTWDLVDASEEKGFELKDVKEDQLPGEMKKMTLEERETYLKEKKAERQKIQEEIRTLSTKRVEYVAEKEKEITGDGASLDQAMISAIRSQAKNKNMTFKK